MIYTACSIKGFFLKTVSKTSSFAMEALAGLASRENFSSVTLRPVSCSDTRELPPYTHPMLLRIKGRRRAEARLMEPHVRCLNSGDDFVLVTQDQVSLQVRYGSKDSTTQTLHTWFHKKSFAASVYTAAKARICVKYSNHYVMRSNLFHGCFICVCT